MIPSDPLKSISSVVSLVEAMLILLSLTSSHSLTVFQPIIKMSDQGASPTPSAPPPPPTGRPPKVGIRGRASAPFDSSNLDATDMPELEYFVAAGPRGYPPLTGEHLKR